MGRTRSTADREDDATPGPRNSGGDPTGGLGEQLTAGPTEEPDLLSLDELAALSGMVPRTIRFYQAEKLLQKPRRDAKDARMARYGTEHVERLRLIGELRDRGLKLPAIATLLAEGDANARIADWLGLDSSLRGSWGGEAARLVQRDELDQLFDGGPAGMRGNLENAGLILRQGDAWLLTNPSLIQLVLRLVRDGVQLDLVLEAGAVLQRCLGEAADELIELFVAARNQGFGSGTETSALVEALRPIAGDAAGIIFAQQLEHAIDRLLSDTRRLRKL